MKFLMQLKGESKSKCLKVFLIAKRPVFGSARSAPVVQKARPRRDADAFSTSPSAWAQPSL